MEEALLCFRSRAYRAAIVSVWVAVVYDIIAKVRVLAAENEPVANEHIKKLDNAIATKNKEEMTAIEKRILETARDAFQFINYLEFEDLEKLQEDRHRCAHPAFISDTLLFNPSPEAVRAHIVHAVTYLLAHHPVSGKAAIEKAVKFIASLLFPKNQADVDKVMDLKYLNRPRSTFPASLTDVLVKGLVRRDVPILLGHEGAVLMALKATAHRHPDAYERKAQETLRKLVLSGDAPLLMNILSFLGAEPRAWEWLDEAAKLQLSNLAENYVFGGGHDGEMLDALAIAPLRQTIMTKLKGLEPDERFALLSANPRAELLDEAVELFVTSPNFRDAEPRGRFVLLEMGHLLSEDQVRRCLQAVPTNYEIRAARATHDILVSYFASAKGAPSFEKLKADWTAMMLELMKNVAETTTKKPFARLVEKMEEAGLGPFDWGAVVADAEARRAAESALWEAEFNAG
jgi:hypothetical protein